jgi:hypothetical protein
MDQTWIKGREGSEEKNGHKKEARKRGDHNVKGGR